jgi:hypothetical protein
MIVFEIDGSDLIYTSYTPIDQYTLYISRLFSARMPARAITGVAGYENQVRKAHRKVTSKWARNVRRPYPLPFRLPSIPPHSERAPVALGSCSSTSPRPSAAAPAAPALPRVWRDGVLVKGPPG